MQLDQISPASFLFITLLTVAALSPSRSYAVVLTCEMGMNQYYPDNNPAFKTVLLNTEAKTVIDGNGATTTTFASSDTAYTFTYETKAGGAYQYIVLRTTGDMNMIHRYAAGHGANYKCEVSRAAPKF